MADKKQHNKKFNRNNNQDEDYNPKYRRINKKVCPLCTEKNFVLDYKNVEHVRKFINERGKILPRRATGACSKHQRLITTTVKRARHIAIVPYTQN